MKRIFCATARSNIENTSADTLTEKVFYFTLKDIMAMVATLKEATGQNIKLTTDGTSRIMFVVEDAEGHRITTDEFSSVDEVPCL